MYINSNGGAFGIYLDTEDMPYSCQKNTYDVFNRLVSTTDEVGNKSTYTYYPSNLRLSKQVTDGSNTTYTGFMWDGSQIAAEFDEDFNITNHYLFGRGQRRISGTDITTNKQTYYIYNVHGDVEALAGAGGVVTKTYRYDAFGNEENETAGDTNPFRYSGEYYDTETGNIYLRNRYYNPSTGTFITEDPARDGGNWYSYCGGDPVNCVDLTGCKASKKAMLIGTNGVFNFDNGVSVTHNDDKEEIVGPPMPDGAYGISVTTRAELENLSTADILARLIYAEDSNMDGQRAVAWVVINRVLTGNDANVSKENLNIRNVILKKSQFTSLEMEGGNERAYSPDTLSAEWKNALLLAETTVETFNTLGLDKIQIRSTLSQKIQNDIGTMTAFRAKYQWEKNYDSNTGYLNERYGGYVEYHYQVGGNVYFRLRS